MGIGVGMPEWIVLNQFGRVVYEAFGEYPYLVGSAVRSKRWRDVDVRLILSDPEFEKWFGPPRSPKCLSLKWNAMCLAFTYLGQHMTGLPIDFQIDQQTNANAKYPNEPRNSLILCAEFVGTDGD